MCASLLPHFLIRYCVYSLYIGYIYPYKGYKYINLKIYFLNINHNTKFIKCYSIMRILSILLP